MKNFKPIQIGRPVVNHSELCGFLDEIMPQFMPDDPEYRKEPNIIPAEFSHEQAVAAQDRIAACPQGETLIDTLSEEDWNSPDADTWNINAGQ